MKVYRISKERVPCSKFVCAYCKHWAPLFSVEKKETSYCEVCLKQFYEVSK